jgi:nitrous oxidase accessory protein
MKRTALTLLVSLAVCRMNGAVIEVGDGQAQRTITSAIAAAAPGDAVRVRAGTYREAALRIAKPLILEGVGTPVLDGELKDAIITVTAPNVTVRGFRIINGGRSSTRELAGIHLDGATGFLVRDNQVVNCDYGIYLSRCGEGEVTANTLEGHSDLEINSGNGIHLWSSNEARVRGNRVSGHRDGIYLEHAGGVKIEENIVEDNMRYGLHFMFSNSSLYRANRFARNGAGVAVMYSREVSMLDNVFERNWGSSAYGLLIKDVTDGEVSGNTFLRNSTGIYAQGATRVKFDGNTFKENGWALRVLSNGADNDFTNNNFLGNSFDVGTNGSLADHRFRRNYWDRYEGYDLKRDGTGDVPFRPVSLFSVITEKVPASLLLMHSAMTALLDRAEKAFPTITPESVVDSEPAMRPHAPRAASIQTQTTPQP